MILPLTAVFLGIIHIFPVVLAQTAGTTTTTWDWYAAFEETIGVMLNVFHAAVNPHAATRRTCPQEPEAPFGLVTRVTGRHRRVRQMRASPTARRTSRSRAPRISRSS